MSSQNKRRIVEENGRLALAYYIEGLHRTKRMPSLKSWLIDPDKVAADAEPQSAEEALAVLREIQEQSGAVMDFKFIPHDKGDETETNAEG